MSEEVKKEDLKQGKLVASLNRKGDAVIDERVRRIIKGAKGEQEDLVRRLDKEVDGLTDKLDNMLDQSPDNRYSLKPGKGFDSEKFTQEYHQTTLELANKTIELEIAKRNMVDLYGE